MNVMSIRQDFLYVRISVAHFHVYFNRKTKFAMTSNTIFKPRENIKEDSSYYKVDIRNIYQTYP